MSDVDTWENPVADLAGGRGAEPSPVGAVTKWVFCARVPVDDPQPTASASKQAGGARSSAPQKKRPAAKTGQPVAKEYGSKEDMWASTRRLAEAAGGADDDIYAETARLAESKDNLEAARSQLEKMEQRFATQRTQMANELMKLNARAREDDAALRECREQLRTRDSTMSKLEAALKQEQQAKAALNEQLSKAKGMLEGANMRALAAQKAQALLAKNLMEDMDSLDQERTAEQALEAKLKISADEITEKAALIEDLTVQVRTLEANLSDTSARADVEKLARDGEIGQLKAQLTELASSSHLQKELTGQAASAAAAQITALFGERAALQEEVGTWREKHVLAMGQLRKAKTMLAVTSVECAALKEQRESARAELAATLAARKKESAEKARASKAAAQAEAKEAKRLETARKERDLQQRINENKSAFHDSQLAASMAAKVQQITALNLQISSLQSELEAQKQLATGLQSEVSSSKELLAASQSQLEQTVAKAAESDAALEQAMASLATAQQSASSAEELLKSESNKAAAAEKSLKQQVGSLTARVSAADERTHTIDVKLQGSEAKLRSTQKELDELRSSSAKLTGQLNAATRRAAVASVATSLRLQAADSQLASLTKESQAGSANVETLSQDYSKLTQLYKQGAAQLEAKTNEAQATEQALQRAEQESASTKQQLARTEKDLGAQKSSLTTRLSQATQKLTELGQDLISARQSLQTAETRAGQAEARVAALEAEKAKMERASRRLADTVGELEAVQTQHEKARAEFIQQVAALRQELDTLWNTHEQTARELATASEAAAQQTGRADGAELALKLCRDELAVAQAKAASGEESEAQRQLEASQAELQQVGGQLSAAQARIAEVAAAAATAASEDSALEASLRKQLASLQSEKQAAEDAASKRIASLTSSGEAAAKKAAQLQQQLEATQEQLRAKTAELEQAVSGAAQEKAAMTAAAEKAARTASDAEAALREQLAEQGTNLSGVRSQLQQREDESKSAGKAFTRLQAAHTELQAEKEQLESELTTTKTAAQEALEHFKNELNFKQNDINELNSAVEQHSNQRAIVQAVQTAHGNEKADLEARLSEMSSVMESLNEQLNVATSTAQRYRLHAITRAIAASAGETSIKEQLETEASELSDQLNAEKAARASDLANMGSLDEKVTNLAAQLERVSSEKAAAEQELVNARKEVVLWRNKARHRHRHLQIPDFEKIYGAKSRAAKKDEWLKEMQLDTALGFDEDTDHVVVATFDTSESLGLGLLNAKDDEMGGRVTVIHSIREGSAADSHPELVQGQLITAINGQPVGDIKVSDVVERLHVAKRPLQLELSPAPFRLKLLAFDDARDQGKKGKKKGKKK